MTYSAVLFKRKISRYFFRVGLCTHTISVLQDAWRCEERWIRLNGGDHVDLSPRDHQMQHVRIAYLKWPRSEGYAMATWRLENRPIIINWRSHDRDLTASTEAAWNSLARRIFIRSDLHRTALRTRGRTPRSRSDQTAIAARSSRDRGAFNAESTPWSSEMFSWRSTARSTPNRRKFKPWSWSIVVDPGEKRGKEMRKSWQNWGQLMAAPEAETSPQGTAPTTLANRLHDRSNGHDCRA